MEVGIARSHEFILGSLMTKNASTVLLMTSLFSPNVAAGAPTFTSDHSPTSKRFPEALRHYCCLHIFISNLPADLQQSLDNASMVQVTGTSPAVQWLRLYSQ